MLKSHSTGNIEHRLLRFAQGADLPGQHEVTRNQREKIEKEIKEKENTEIIHGQLSQLAIKIAIEGAEKTIRTMDAILPGPPPRKDAYPTEAAFHQAEALHREKEQKMDKEELEKLIDALARLGTPALPILLARCRNAVESADQTGFRVFADAVTRLCALYPAQLCAFVEILKHSTNPDEQRTMRLLVAIAGIDAMTLPGTIDENSQPRSVPPRMQWALTRYALEHPETDIRALVAQSRAVLFSLDAPGSPEEMAQRYGQLSATLRASFENQVDRPVVPEAMMQNSQVLAEALRARPREEQRIQSALKTLNAAIATVPPAKQRQIAQYLLVLPLRFADGGGDSATVTLLSLLLAENSVPVIRDTGADGGVAIVLEQVSMKDGSASLGERVVLSILEQRNPVSVQSAFQGLAAALPPPRTPEASPAQAAIAATRIAQEQPGSEATFRKTAMALLESPTATSRDIAQVAEVLAGSALGIEALAVVFNSEHPASTRLAAIAGMQNFWELQLQGKAALFANVRDLISATTPVLQLALGDQAAEIQGAAIGVLERMIGITAGITVHSGTPNMEQAFRPEDVSTTVRTLIHPQDYHPLLLRFLTQSSTDERMRLRVITLLGVLGQPSDASLLLQLVRSESLSAAERAAAAHTLVRLSSDILRSDNQYLLPQLIESLLGLYADLQNVPALRQSEIVINSLHQLRRQLAQQLAFIESEVTPIQEQERTHDSPAAQQLRGLIQRINATVGSEEIGFSSGGVRA